MAERLPPSGVCKAGTAPERRRTQLAGGEVCRHRLLRKRKKHPEPCRSQSGSRRSRVLFIGSQLAAVRLWGVQRRKSELVFAKGRTQDGRPRFRVDAKFGVDVPVQEHHPPPQRKDVGGGHSGVGDALAVLQVVIADVRDGYGSVHETQIFGVEQLILRKQFFAEMEAVLPQEVTAVELVAGAAIVEGVRLLDQMLCVLLSGVHPGSR